MTQYNRLPIRQFLFVTSIWIGIFSLCPVQAQITTPDNNETVHSKKTNKPETNQSLLEPSDRDFSKSQQTSLDINPTQALFDAIEKGDIGRVREAITRGVNMNNRNMLGQTPLDLSIDLNQKKITFLLLSLRDNSILSPEQAHTGPLSSTTPSALLKASTRSAKKHTPHYDSSGGVPVPSVGFLGFDPH